MPPVAAGQTSMNDVWMPPPRHPDERISIGWRRHPDERIFRYPLQALVVGVRMPPFGDAGKERGMARKTFLGRDRS